MRLQSAIIKAQIVAHIVQLPMRFEFRIARLHWIEAQGRIVGLGGDIWGQWEFQTEVTAGTRKKRVRLPREDVPPELWNRWIDTTHTLHEGDDFDKVAEQIFCDFRPCLLIGFRPHASDKRSVPADAWQLRDAFLRLAPDVQSVVSFLNRWGHWSGDEHTQLQKIIGFQEVIRNGLLSSSEEWLSDGLNSALGLTRRRSEYPYFALETVDCEPAIRATVTIDLLQQVKFRTCARRDCGQPFPIESRHHRKY